MILLSNFQTQPFLLKNQSGSMYAFESFETKDATPTLNIYNMGLSYLIEDKFTFQGDSGFDNTIPIRSVSHPMGEVQLLVDKYCGISNLDIMNNIITPISKPMSSSAGAYAVTDQYQYCVAKNEARKISLMDGSTEVWEFKNTSANNVRLNNDGIFTYQETDSDGNTTTVIADINNQTTETFGITEIGVLTPLVPVE